MGNPPLEPKESSRTVDESDSGADLASTSAPSSQVKGSEAPPENEKEVSPNETVDTKSPVAPAVPVSTSNVSGGNEMKVSAASASLKAADEVPETKELPAESDSTDRPSHKPLESRPMTDLYAKG